MITLPRILALLLLSSFSLPAFSAKVTGVIDNVYSGSVMKGWACVTTRTGSIPIHIYVGGPAGAGTLLASDMASDYSETAVDNACQHGGQRGRHRFSFTFTEAQKRAHQGKKIYVHGIGSGVSNLTIGRSGTFTVPKPTPVVTKPQGIGRIGGVKNNWVTGWACVKGQTSSTYVDFYAGGRLIQTVLASKAGTSSSDSAAIASACGHSGRTGNHRFNVLLSNREKTLYAGQKLSARVRDTGTLLANSSSFSVPGDVSYKFAVPDQPGQKATEGVTLEWNTLNTKNCSAIKGTVVSFPGGSGTGHGASLQNVKRVEAVLGRSCVRLVRAHVNPDSNSSSGGYWLWRSSYRNAATLVTNALRYGSSSWQDADGKPPFQGKLIVAGSSAGGMVAAAALEWSSTYRSLVDRTIMISAPLGADISYECGVLRNDGIKRWIDSIFRTGTTCRSCTNPTNCGISTSKDVVNMANKRVRSYVQTDPTSVDTHEIAILVGSHDGLGCVDGNRSNDCGPWNWNADSAAQRYIRSITGNNLNMFQNGGISSRFRPTTLNVISGGTHDLWNSSTARKLICGNALNEVSASIRSCESL
jgi:hypothetical protein